MSFSPKQELPSIKEVNVANTTTKTSSIYVPICRGKENTLISLVEWYISYSGPQTYHYLNLNLQCFEEFL